jgi:prevent-host-death family protein
MKEVGVYEAKTHLPALLNDVERGETIVITRHGRPIARLSPIEPGRRNVEETIAAIKAFGERHTLDGVSLRELIEEGRV